MSRHGRVLVAMSGGVDSSVAAALLHEQGYDVVGATMKTWDHATTLGSGRSRWGASGANASGANASGANASGANASGANASGANASGANASGANASGANASGANASGANASGANASGANTSGGAASGAKPVGCCSLDDMHDARAVCVRMGVPHFIVDIRDEFGSFVIDRFERDYLSGRTPNPCVLCNTHVKWAALLKRADALGCEHIATGHYARVREASGEGPAPEASGAAGSLPPASHIPPEPGRWVLSRGVDRNKDQSYALWGVAQEHLARTLLPIGGMTKPEIRALAAEMGHPEVANKKDSYEICFVPDGDYRGWLERRRPEMSARVGGDFVLEASGEVVGRHRGTPFYTVGQRRGLDLALGEPVYVTRIDAETETVYVGPKSALDGRTVRASEVNWVGRAGLPPEAHLTAQVRYKDPGAPALAWQAGADAVEVVFEAPRPAPAPGQALVLYSGEDVVAGGWIDAALRDGAPEASGDGAEMHTELPILL